MVSLVLRDRCVSQPGAKAPTHKKGIVKIHHVLILVIVSFIALISAVALLQGHRTHQFDGPPRVGKEVKREVVKDGTGKNQIRTVKLEVQRVFLHSESGRAYSVLYHANNSIELLHMSLSYPRIFTDAPKDKPMWLQYEETADNQRATNLELHIHSAKEINGAGWDHGKAGSGMTIEIE